MPAAHRAGHGRLSVLEEGTIDDVARFVGTDGPLYWIMRGDEESLRELQMMPENLALQAKCGFVLTDFGSGVYVTGEAAEAMLDMYEQTATELHLI